MTTKQEQTKAPAKTTSRKIAALMEGKNGNLYIKFDQPVTFTTFKGEKVESQYLNLDKPLKTLERLLGAGFIDEKTFNSRAEKLEDMPYLKYEVSVSVPKE
jgi:hypothetical protein